MRIADSTKLVLQAPCVLTFSLGDLFSHQDSFLAHYDGRRKGPLSSGRFLPQMEPQDDFLFFNHCGRHQLGPANMTAWPGMQVLFRRCTTASDAAQLTLQECGRQCLGQEEQREVALLLLTSI